MAVRAGPASNAARRYHMYYWYVSVNGTLFYRFFAVSSGNKKTGNLVPVWQPILKISIGIELSLKPNLGRPLHVVGTDAYFEYQRFAIRDFCFTDVVDRVLFFDRS